MVKRSLFSVLDDSPEPRLRPPLPPPIDAEWWSELLNVECAFIRFEWNPNWNGLVHIYRPPIPAPCIHPMYVVKKTRAVSFSKHMIGTSLLPKTNQTMVAMVHHFAFHTFGKLKKKIDSSIEVKRTSQQRSWKLLRMVYVGHMHSTTCHTVK